MNNLVNEAMKKWAKNNGLSALYEEYLEECEAIAEQCEEEGYAAYGNNYELRVAQLQALEYYAPLFEGDED